MKILIVDDERTLHKLREGNELTHCRYAEAAYGLIADGNYYDQVWLDHDMGPNARDGKWLAHKIEALAYEDVLVNVKEFVIHSANPVGRMAMSQALNKFYNVRFVRAEDYL